MPPTLEVLMSSSNPFSAPVAAESQMAFGQSVGAPMTVGEILFSFDGRIGRQTYWLAYLCSVMVAVTVMLTAALVGLPEDLFMILMLVLYLPLGWIGLAISVKRWHDRNKSGWWVLIGLVPYIGGLWQLVECGFLEGTYGSNDYGADPIPR